MFCHSLYSEEVARDCIAMLCTRPPPTPVFLPPLVPILISLQVNWTPHLHEVTLFQTLPLVLPLLPMAPLVLIVFTVLLCRL